MNDTLQLRCGLKLRGRIALAPMTNTQSNEDGSLGEDELKWLVRRATGGFTWVSTCAAFVSEEGHAWKGQLGIASDDHVPGLTRLATALHEAGALCVAQLHHGGPQAKLAPNGPLVAVATADGQRAATEEDFDRVIADFAAAAVRAEEAGFDGVEIHGANGYLFTHFLSPVENTRDDDWGGDLRGRARLLRKTLQAVGNAVSPTFAVGVRLSPVDGHVKRGLLLEDSLEVGSWMVDDGADFIHLSLSDAAGSAPEDPRGIPVARAFRQQLTAEVPVFAAGGIWTRYDLDRVQEAGVDVGVIAKAAIANPEWPTASMTPHYQPERPPYTRELLSAADVGDSFIDYLATFPGMVEGGAPKR